MSNLEEYTYSYLLSAAQMGLLYEVVPSIRGVAVDWQQKTILVYFYIDGEISEELREDCSCIGTEIVAHFTEAKIDERIIRVDYPNVLPRHAYWVYLRYEDKTVPQDVAVQDYKRIDLSVVYALLGKIRPSLRGVALIEENQKMILFFYPDDEMGNKAKEYYEDIAEHVRKLNPQQEIVSRIERKAVTSPLPEYGLNWIYRRKE